MYVYSLFLFFSPFLFFILYFYILYLFFYVINVSCYSRPPFGRSKHLVYRISYPGCSISSHWTVWSSNEPIRRAKFGVISSEHKRVSRYTKIKCKCLDSLLAHNEVNDYCNNNHSQDNDRDGNGCVGSRRKTCMCQRQKLLLSEFQISNSVIPLSVPLPVC